MLENNDPIFQHLQNSELDIPFSDEPIHVLVVGGIFGHLLALRFLGRYMWNLKFVFNKIFQNSSFEYFQPNLFMKLNQSSDEIALRMRQSYFIHHRRVLLVGHSKGGLQALLSLLQNPDITTDQILVGALLLNSPYNGSVIANVCFKILRYLKIKLTTVDELTSHYCKQLWSANLAKLTEPHLDQIKKKCVFLVSETQIESELAWPLVPTFRMLSRSSIKSDGLISTESQMPPFQSKQVLFTHNHHGHYVCGAQLSNVTLIQQIKLFSQLIKMIDTNCLKTSRFEHAQKAVTPIKSVPQKLRVGTFNLGLLNIPVFGVPFNAERWEKIPQALLESDCDIYFLQEIFSKEYRKQLGQLFPEYQIFLGEQKNNHGLAMMIRRSILSEYPSAKNNFSYESFESQRLTEPLARFEKGYMLASIFLKGETQVLHLVNLHLTAFSNAHFIRRKQLRQIVRDVITPLSQNQVGWLILGGDFNRSLRTSLKPQESTFSQISRLSNYKNIFNRDPSQTIDYILPQSLGAPQTCRAERLEVKYSDATVHVPRSKKNSYLVELSDHKMIFVDITLQSGILP